MKRNMSPAQLANLKKPKPSHHEYERKYQIPRDKIDKLFSLLANDIPLSNAAKEVGIKYSTAKKYFILGDPRRSIEPLKNRLAIFRYRKTERLDNTILRRQKYLLAVIRRQIAIIRKQLEEEGFKKPSYAALEKMVNLELKLARNVPVKDEEITGISGLTGDDIRKLTQKVNEDGSETDTGSGDQGVDEVQR